MRKESPPATRPSKISVLAFQFGDELQIASGQVGLDPAVDLLVQLGVEVVLPVARFTCGTHRQRRGQYGTARRLRLLRVSTFADEVSAAEEGAAVLHRLFVDGFVFGEVVDAQVLGQAVQLLLRQRLLQEIGHLFYFSAQILNRIVFFQSKLFEKKLIETGPVSCPRRK